MVNKDNNIYEEFKLNFPIIERDVVGKEQIGRYAIRLFLADDSVVQYNSLRGTLVNVPKYDGTDGSWKRVFAHRLDERMNEAGIDQSMLAEHSGVSQGSISKYLKGTAVPSAMAVSKLAIVLGCHVSDLTEF